MPVTPADAALRWGHYFNCDSPWETVPDLTQQINRSHPVKHILIFFI